MKKRWKIPVPENWVNENGYGFLDKTPWGLHPGFDFNSPEGGFSDLGKPIWACADGVVETTIEGNSGFGNHIFIKHEIDNEIYYSHYAHLQFMQVTDGDAVEMGEQIGTCGSSGNSSASHLHFEIRKPIGQGYEFWPSDWGAEKITKYYFDPVKFIKEQEVVNTEMTYEEVKQLIKEFIEEKADKNSVWPKFTEIEENLDAFRSDFEDFQETTAEHRKVTDEIFHNQKLNIETLISSVNELSGELRALQEDVVKIVKVNENYMKTLNERLDNWEGVSDEVEVKSFWDNLPKEVKVSVYVIGSALIGEAVKMLSGLNLDSVILTGLINVFIVFLVEMRKRIKVRGK